MLSINDNEWADEMMKNTVPMRARAFKQRVTACKYVVFELTGAGAGAGMDWSLMVKVILYLLSRGIEFQSLLGVGISKYVVVIKLTRYGLTKSIG